MRNVILVLSLLFSANAFSASNILLGSFPGVDHREAFARWLGKEPAVEVMFADWEKAQTAHTLSYINYIWSRGAVPMLTWELFTGNNRTSEKNINTLIHSGKYDDYIKDFRASLKKWLAGPNNIYGDADDRRLYIRLGHEMNGDWYPWAPGFAGSADSDKDYVKMWQHVHDLIGAEINSGHVQWMWIPMNCTCSRSMKSLYPGDQYVDWVGVDAYNWGPYQASGWQSPEKMLKPFLDKLADIAPNKPIAIPEIAAVPEGGDKTQWVRDMAGFTSYYVGPRGQRIHLISYFNARKNEQVAGGAIREIGFAVFETKQQVGSTAWTDQGDSGKGTYYTFPSYKALIGGWANYIGANRDGHNPRLLTNSQFWGKE